MSICHFPSAPIGLETFFPQEEVSEIRQAVQSSLDVQCFIPKDRRIRERYEIADCAIRALSFHPISLNSFLRSRMILQYCMDKADCAIREFSLFPTSSSSIFYSPVLESHYKDRAEGKKVEKFSQDRLSALVNTLAERRFITKGPYNEFLQQIAVFGTCERQAKARSRRIEELALILFSHLTLSEQAKIKVDADRLSVFLRIYEKIPSLSQYKLSSQCSYVDHSEVIKQKMIIEEGPLQIEELDLENTDIETISPEVFYHLKDVKKLHFGGNKSSSLSILSQIAELENLEELDLSNNAFTLLPPAFFSRLDKLKLLDLRNNQFPPEEISRISALCQAKEGLTLYI